MRICMIIEAWRPIWGGGQAHVWELANKLVQKNNCEVDIFVMDIKGTDESKSQAYEKDKLRVFRLGHNLEFKFFDRIRWCSKLVKIVKREHRKNKYDLIHTHANLPGIPGKILSNKLRIPIVYTVHGCGLEAIKDMYKNFIASNLLYLFENFLQTKIKYDFQITVDKSFLKYKNINKKKTIIPNGVNIEKFDEVKSIQSETFKIIFVGRLHPQKGLSYLLKALHMIKNELRDTEVHLIGGGPEEKELKELTKKLGLENLVKFRGKIYKKELFKEYKSSDLFVLPSLYEGQPLTLLEAWAAKLPVIVTNVGGNEDFVVNEKNGYIIPSKNIDVLAKTILKAKNNKDLKVLGLKGYKLVKEKYSWSSVAEKTYRVYEQIL